MSKVLILEPFYTNLHIDLAGRLSSDIYSFIFNIGNILFSRGSKQLFIQKQILNAPHTFKDMQIAQDTKSLYTETSRKLLGKEPSDADFVYMAKYVSFLRHFLEDKKINLVIMHNDLRWQHALGIQVCKELGVQYLVSECGLFRPDTMTIDILGVNAFSSIPRNTDFYHSLKPIASPLKKYHTNRLGEITNNLRFMSFLLLNKFGDILSLNSPLKNKQYKVSSYLHLFMHRKFKFSKNTQMALPKKYIFVPLQVNTDTQILIHSDFKNMQAFITQVEADFYSFDSEYELVFKVHPMEGGGSYSFDDRSLVVNVATQTLIKHCELVITINSTVGFEAIQAYKKVIVLGDAFYKIDGIAVCSSIDSLKNDLLDFLNDTHVLDKELISKFVCYLRSQYQINGNLFNYDSETLDAIEKLLRVSKQC